MPNLNKIMLMGHVSRDVEQKFLPSGDAVANVGLAVSEQWTDKASGEKKENTTWFNLSFFGKVAEIAGSYIKKGDPIYVEGKIRNREYEKDGVKRTATEVVVDRLQLLRSKGDREAEPVKREQPKAMGDGSSAGFNDFESDFPL